jgi:hypothetical protein
MNRRGQWARKRRGLEEEGEGDVKERKGRDNDEAE